MSESWTPSGEERPVYRIQPEDRALATQFLAQPLAPPGPDLLRLLSRLRWEALAGKYVLVCIERHRRWVLGQLTGGRGRPVQLLPEHSFADKAAAERMVFRLRWKRATGENLE